MARSGSFFPPEERIEMIRKGTADIPNCYIYASDLYLISRATFPAYFIKDKVRAETVKADLDIEFFAGRLAPALRITARYVGQEPLDSVTRAYNERMKEVLPQRGISLEEIPRLTDAGGEIISAGRVRDLLRKAKEQTGQGRDQILGGIRDLVPLTTYEMILKRI